MQRKIILYLIVLGPVGQAFTLSCRVDMNFVGFVITLKSSFTAGPSSCCSSYSVVEEKLCKYLVYSVRNRPGGDDLC